MPTKTWIGGASGATGDLAKPDNWKPLTIRSAAYKWTASGSGTSEYYLELAAGGDPSIPAPGNVQEDGTNLTEATAGALVAGEWDYADNDTLGYSTIYIRTTASVDPDTLALDYLTYTSTPIASDDVVIPVTSSYLINAGLQSLASISLGAVTVEEFPKAIASETEWLRLTCTSFTFDGAGVAYIDLQGSAIAPVIRGTAASSTGTRGLYLVGSALTTVVITGGHVGIAWRAGETASVTAVKISAGSVWIGSGCTLTTLYRAAGSAILRAACTTVTCQAGTLVTEGSGAITTLNANGGTVTPNSTGTVGTCVLDGGTLDEQASMEARTISTLTYRAGTLKRNPDAVTHTTESAATRMTTDVRTEV